MITACPHCGDTHRGYEYRVRCVDVRNGPWGQESESAEIIYHDYPKTVTCSGCGKRVPLAVAEGRAEPQGTP